MEEYKIAEKFFESQVKQIVEFLNDDRDNKIVLSKEDMEAIVDSLLNDDGLYEEIDWRIKDTINYFAEMEAE